METQDKHSESSQPLDELSQVTEALVFGADEPIHADRISQIFAEIRGAERPANAEIEDAVDRLNAVYEQTGHGLRIYRWADGFRMATVPEVAPFLKAFLTEQRSRRLSRSLMEALAVVAYRQPVTKPEVDFVRGVDSDYALRKLMELDMVDVIGRSDAVGRPLLYGTTSTFLDKFGLDGLDSLPNLREVEELLSDPAFNSEKARLLLRASLFDIPGDDDPPQHTNTAEDPISIEQRAERPVAGDQTPAPVPVDDLAHANGSDGGNGRNGNTGA